MFCWQCGTQLRDDARFCTHCGVKIEMVAPPPSKGLVPPESPAASEPALPLPPQIPPVERGKAPAKPPAIAPAVEMPAPPLLPAKAQPAPPVMAAAGGAAPATPQRRRRGSLGCLGVFSIFCMAGFTAAMVAGILWLDPQWLDNAAVWRGPRFEPDMIEIDGHIVRADLYNKGEKGVPLDSIEKPQKR
jgi:hypothetical protein